jgi:general secretion pathway protein K
MSAPVRQRGVALLTAVLIVAVAALLIAMIVDQGGVALARTRNLMRAEQADALALGMEDWAFDLLRRDAANDPGRDARSDLWAQPLPPTPVQGGQIAGRMVDQNGCFNLNNLVVAGQHVETELRRFRRLLEVLELDPEISLAVVDWVDPDAQPELRGAEDTAYLGLRPAYRAANRPFAHATELRLVRGIDGAAWSRLAPHVCALPAPSALNVNTAGVPLLMALDPRISEPIARRLARDGVAQYSGLTEFESELQALDLAAVDLSGVDVQSNYFLARADVELDGLPFTYTSLLLREPGRLRVLARWRGSP